MEQGGFSSQEELRETVDRMIDEADRLTFAAFSLYLKQVRGENDDRTPTD